MFAGLYIIQTDEMHGQPHYVKQDFEPGDKDLHWSGSSWDIGGLHGRCGMQDCLAVTTHARNPPVACDAYIIHPGA